MSAPRHSMLTTHALDTVRGVPAVGLIVELWRLSASPYALVVATALNEQGRTDAPLLGVADFIPGTYELRFFIGDYFRTLGLGDEPPFLDMIPLRVTLLAGRGHYHVPLLATPWSYATYRGS